MLKEPFGFIIIRHARTETDDLLGEVCFTSIRRFYPNVKICILNDHSITSDDPFYIDERTEIIHASEDFHPGVGEMLAWYYTFTKKLFEYTCVLHDSMAIAGNLPPITSGFLWHFHGSHLLGNHGEERLMSLLTSGGVYQHMVETQNTWKGCFGMCGVFSQEDLKKLNEFVPILTKSFLNNIHTRTDRMAMERIFGWACCVTKIAKCSYLNDIHTFPNAFYPSSDEDAVNDLITRISTSKTHVVKVWRGR